MVRIFFCVIDSVLRLGFRFLEFNSWGEREEEERNI